MYNRTTFRRAEVRYDSNNCLPYVPYHFLCADLVVLRRRFCPDLQPDSPRGYFAASAPAIRGFSGTLVLHRQKTGQMDISPLRTADFTANINNLLESKPGNLTIGDIDASNFLTQGRLDCTVTLKHPFPGLDQYDGFDAGVSFITANQCFRSIISHTAVVPPLARTRRFFSNADGYTRWFNEPEFDGGGAPIFRILSRQALEPSDAHCGRESVQGFRRRA